MVTISSPGTVRLPRRSVEGGLEFRVCARHGLPVTHTRRAVFQSRIGWGWFSLLLGWRYFVDYRQNSVQAVGTWFWGYCDKCSARRAFLFIAGTIAVIVAGGVLIAGLILEVRRYAGGALLGAAVATAVGGLALIANGDWAEIAGGRVNRKTLDVEFAKPAPAFATAVAQRPAEGWSDADL